MRSRNKRIFIVVLLLGTLQLFAQTSSSGSKARTKSKAPQAPPVGQLTGRVFSITKGGDLKPGRMARVYLAKSAFSYVFSRGISDALEKTLKYEEMFHTMPSCASQALGWVHAEQTMLEGTKSTAENVTKGAKPEPSSLYTTTHFYTTTADENGNFSFTNLASSQPDDLYTLIAIGRAGFYEGYWKEENIAIRPGINPEVKLSSFDGSCLNEE
jgi:hypothetical protein